ncbi:MAG: DUF4013 domain-containing protein [Brevefilum sp.]|jgi:hypothetical protein
MNFGLAFSYVFKDNDWFKKLAIAALFSLIPVVGQFVLVGWGLRIAKNVIDGNKEYPLPNVSFGEDLSRGFMAMLISAIYILPIAILLSLASGIFSFGAGADEPMMYILYALGGCFGLVGLVAAILVGFLSVAALANYVAKGQFGAAFNFKQVFGLVKKSFLSWLLVIVGQILAMGIIAPLGSIACVIGVFLTMAYGTAVYSHLLGQAYNASTEPVAGSVEVL